MAGLPGAAVTASGSHPGHPFRGNQWTVGDLFKKPGLPDRTYRVKRVNGSKIYYLGSHYGDNPPRGIIREASAAEHRNFVKVNATQAAHPFQGNQYTDASPWSFHGVNTVKKQADEWRKLKESGLCPWCGAAKSRQHGGMDRHLRSCQKKPIVQSSNYSLLSAVRAERLARRVEAVRAAGGADVSKFGCLMAQLPSLDSELPNWAADNIKSGTLAEEGIETETHCTVLYGFNLDFDSSKLQQEYGGITLKLGKVSRFECPEYDVLKLAVESPDLVALNERLMREFENEVTPSKWSYNPHVTIAYVQKGTNKNLDGDKTFEGREIRVRQLLYSLPEKQGRVVIEASSTQQRNAVHAATDTLQTAHALVRDAGGLVLILKDSHYGTWDLPGGHLQRGETLLAGLSREVREETGLTPHVFHLSNRQQGAGDVYETTVAGHKPHVTLSSEHSEYRWVEQSKADLLAPYRLGGTALSQHRNAQAAAAAANRLAIHKAVTFAEGSVLHRQAATDAGKAAVAAGMLGLLAFGAFKAYQAASTALATPEPAPRYFAPPDEERPQGEPPSDAGGPLGEPVAQPEEEPAGTGADVDKEAEVFSGERREKLTGLAEETVGELEAERTAGVAAGNTESELSARLGKLAEKLENETWSSAVNTEAQAAYGNAQLRMLARGGFRTKAWVSLHDDRVRPSHVKCDAQGAIPIADKFVNGLLHPGDPDGPPEEVCNCRCIIVGVDRV